MTKATVLVRRAPEDDSLKCIFSGEIHNIPQIGSYVDVIPKFPTVAVEEVRHSLACGSVEIIVSGFDSYNGYPEVTP